MKFDYFCMVVFNDDEGRVEHHHFENCIVMMTVGGIKITACDTEFCFLSKDIISVSGIV